MYDVTRFKAKSVLVPWSTSNKTTLPRRHGGLNFLSYVLYRPLDGPILDWVM